MSISTKIQWCDSTCNPTMGCEGCELWTGTVKKCYAGVLHLRFGGVTKGYSPTFEQLTYHPGRMAAATRWTDLEGKPRDDKPWLNGLPRLIFVSDMSDSLSSSVTFDFLDQEIIQNVLSPIGQRHRWLWVTKRAERMAKFSLWLAKKGTKWPTNLWAGTSITTNATISRVKRLLEVGDTTTTRFLSVEPQYESVDLTKWLPQLDWVIQGGESGHNARSFDLAWAYEVKDQCHEYCVPYFLKQLGTVVVENGNRIRFDNHHGGDWSEWPTELQRRQMPKHKDGRFKGGGTKSITEEEDQLSRSAKRAWKTRRANAAKQKRTDAAHKAWNTRRRNQLKKKRSEAAKKAWRTRRDNGNDKP
ncbi:MAG: DUF5131 family protein [Planctomycetota bacterium]